MTPRPVFRDRDPTPAEICAAIHDPVELDGYRVGLSEQGLLTTEAMRAIRERQDALKGWRG